MQLSKNPDEIISGFFIHINCSINYLITFKKQKRIFNYINTISLFSIYYLIINNLINMLLH